MVFRGWRQAVGIDLSDPYCVVVLGLFLLLFGVAAFFWVSVGRRLSE